MRRLYYLLPTTQQAEQMCADLCYAQIATQQLHAVVRNASTIRGVADIHTMDEIDRDEQLERKVWAANLLLFFLALLIFIALLLFAPSSWLLVPLLLMLITFGAGCYFALRVPNVHLREFIPALAHGEVLMMVDVPATKMVDVDHLVHRQHPEAITGGVCWTL